MALRLISRTDNNAYDNTTKNYLLGNYNDFNKTTLFFEAVASVRSSLLNQLKIEEDGSVGRIIRFNGSWVDDGFEIGDSFTYSYYRTGTSNNNVTYTGIITNLNNTSFEYTTTSTQSVTFPMAEDSDGITHVYMEVSAHTESITIGENTYKAKSFRACQLNYNKIANNDVNSLISTSVSDLTTSIINFDGIDPLTTTQSNGVFIGNRSGGSIISAKIKGMGYGNANVNVVIPFRYEIEIIHSISQFTEDYTDILNGQTADWFLDNNCLTDNYTIEARRTINDPNLKLVNNRNNLLTKKLGNTGGVNENFNGGVSPFSLNTVKFYDSSGIEIAGISYNQSTKIVAEINTQSILNLSNAKFGFSIQYLPLNETQWKENVLTNAQNTILNCINLKDLQSESITSTPVSGTVQGFENTEGARLDVTSRHFESLNGNTIATIVIQPNSAFTTYMEARQQLNRNLGVFFSVGSTAALETSKRTTLSYLNEFIEYVTPLGNFPTESPKFFINNTYDTQEPVFSDWDLNATNIKYHIEDNGLLELDMIVSASKNSVNVFNQNANLYDLIKVTPSISLINKVTGNKIELQLTEFSFQNEPIVNNIQEANISQTIGFNYSNTDVYNVASFKRNTSIDQVTLDINFIGYKLMYPFRIRWEDFIENSDIPSDLYDLLKLNNNFNNDYLSKQVGDYVISASIEFQVFNKTFNQNQTYVNSVSLSLLDRTDKGTIKTFTEDGLTELVNNNNPIIQTDSDTLIEAKQETGLTGISTNQVRYGEITLEAYQNATFLNSYRIDTRVPVSLGLPIKPLSSEDRVNVSIVGTEIVLKALIDYSVLPTDIEFRISSYLDYDDNIVIPNGKITEEGLQKETEDNNSKQIE